MMNTFYLFLAGVLLCITASNCAHQPQSLAAMAADEPVAYLPAIVTRISEEYANINTDLSGVELSKHGIADQTIFTVKYGDRTIRALLAKDYGDVARGDWVALIEDDGNLQLAISFGHAATEIGCAVGDTLYIEPLSGGK
jgi:S-adenosylmethionine hydrolase